MNFKRVVIESPYAGDIQLNMFYLSQCMRDCVINYNESPYASHGLLPLALDDDNPVERDKGLTCGYAWQEVADKVVIYTDLGVSEGMIKAMDSASKLNIETIYRKLPEELMKEVRTVNFDYV